MAVDVRRQWRGRVSSASAQRSCARECRLVAAVAGADAIGAGSVAACGGAENVAPDSTYLRECLHHANGIGDGGADRTQMTTGRCMLAATGSGMHGQGANTA